MISFTLFLAACRYLAQYRLWSVLGLVSVLATGCAQRATLFDEVSQIVPESQTQTSDDPWLANASQETVTFQPPAQTPAQQTAAPLESVEAVSSKTNRPFPTSANPTVDEAVVRLEATMANASSGIRQVSFEQTAFAEPSSAVVTADGAVAATYPHTPRVGEPCGFGCPCPSCNPEGSYALMVNGPGVVAWDPTHYPDEYLCDGGDRDYPFHYEGRKIGGLETEDTVAEAQDITGKHLVVPSSKVCVYAPRFGAVRSISGTSLARDVQQATGAHDGLRLAGIDTHLGIDEQTQRDQLLQFDMRSRASGIDSKSRDSSFAQGEIALQHQNQLAAFQNLAFLQEGQFQQSDLAVLSYGVQTAGLWTRDQNPVIAGHDLHGHEIEAEFNAHEFSVADDTRTPGLLRVVKLADRETARPGDVLTFTIRFDNLGQTELTNIRITDNLTPRLEYVPGSATCELAGGLDIEPNGEGSSILTFRLDAPLAGETGGVLTFQCRVR